MSNNRALIRNPILFHSSIPSRQIMAMVLDAFVGAVVEKLATLVIEKVAMVSEVKDELKRLQRRMVRISKFLETAERRQLEDPDIKHWVSELKDVAYAADDIIDLCRTEGALLPIDEPSPTEKKVACFNSSCCLTSIPHRYQIAESIKSLNEKLEEIYSDRQKFNLEKSREKQKSQTITEVNTRQTSSVQELNVVGEEIEEAARELVNMIAEENLNKCRFFAVTGMGGIGKTTLAKEIINNEKIKTDFQIKLWVCVSQSYNEIELLQRVIRGAEGNYGEATTKEELEPLLKSVVDGKSIFLVLDDVWRDDVWTSLLESLLTGVTIVRILVTTRDVNVARGMGVPEKHIHAVNQLSNETSWELLRQSVLVEGGEEEIKKLEKLGIQIVTKCSGLPLAVKAIAGVLKKKGTNRTEWEKVLKNEAWSMSNLPKELRGALYLSYDDLPSHLKQCFVYCSLLPKSEYLYSDDLVRKWVAEGFVRDQSDTLMEDVAEEYYNELIKRNLLQAHQNDHSTFTIHDLLKSLATFLSQDEFFLGETMSAATSTSSTSKLRRISVLNQEGISGMEDLIIKQSCLRTLLNYHGINKLNDNLLAGLVCLRVLVINDSDIDTIPNSIGDLIHLRYLDFDRTNIEELPESIGSLTNLQFLNLCRCRFLTALPKSITKLHNLRRLGLRNTTLNFFPKGISKLEKINDLDGFVVADPTKSTDSCSSLEELNSLYQIRKLSISKMERAQKGGLSLQKLTRLVELKLMYTKEEEDGPLRTEEDIRRIEDVLEELCPPPRLEDLHIRNFFGKHYPSWMKSPSFGEHFPHLTNLELLNNILCRQLPPVGELPQLSSLYIDGAVSVKSIGPEFLGTSTGTDFPNLRMLVLRKMPELEDWTFIKEKEGFEREERENAHLLPQLDRLIIFDCPKLKALPKELEQSKIKKIHIKNADSLRAVENLLNVKEYLGIENSKSLKRVSNLPALQVLRINNCQALNCVEKLDSLQRLFLYDTVMDAVPEWLPRLLQGRKPTDDDDFLFQLVCNKKVLRRLLREGPDWPKIEGIPRVYAFEDVESDIDGFLQYTRHPYSYETNFGVHD